MRYFFLIFISFLSLSFGQYRYGTTAVNFLEIGTSGRAVSMGEAFVSLADDVNSAYWNPAGLAFINGLEFGVSSQDWVVGITHSTFAAAIDMGNYGTISTWFTDFDYGSTEVTNILNQNGTGEYYNANELSASLSYGRTLVDWFAFGASLKMISSNIWHSTARASALDLGVIVKTNFFSVTGDRKSGMNIGMSISNYGSKMRYDGIDLINPIDILENENGNYENVIGQFRTESWELPLIFRLGSSIRPIVNDVQNLIISIDVLHPNNNSESLNFGSEYSHKLIGGHTMFLRAGIKGIGIKQANESELFSGFDLPFSTTTFGLGYEKSLMNNKSISFDYSYQSIGVLGNVSLLTIRFKLF
ncbi:MAG: PorV/PorQ family protein [Candidatus Neomarinimicrobiota bacterium]|tara:strand:+ start:394 stop:1470 length:1077 start_codon:yes stop_codon:yes gene_type:complete